MKICTLCTSHCYFQHNTFHKEKCSLPMSSPFHGVLACIYFEFLGLLSQLGMWNTPTAPLQRGKTPPSNKCPGYDTKQSDGEVPVILELWRMRSTLSLPLLPRPLWPEMVAPDRVPSMGQIELNCVLMLNWITWNSTVLIFNLHTYAKLFEIELFLRLKLYWH